MKKIFILFLFLIINFNSFGQTPSWVWTHTEGDSLNDWSSSIATDDAGNIYVVGNFRNQYFSFGSYILENDSFSWQDIFIVKYNPNGNVIWAKREGGSGNDVAGQVVVSSTGDVFVAGEFASDSIIFGITTLVNHSSSYDFFIAKYDTAGNNIWAKSAGGINEDYPLSIAADESGNIYCSGLFGSPTISFGSTTFTNAGWEDLFIVKYSDNGNVVWAKKAGGTGIDAADAIAIDAFGNVYVGGSFYSPTISFDSFILTSTNVWPDLFITKYDPSGNVVWAKSAYGSAIDRVNAIKVDVNNNVYVTGTFASPYLILDSITLINSDTATYYEDIFVARLNASGNVVWANSYGSALRVDLSNSIITDDNGDFYLIGDYRSGIIQFGSVTLTNTFDGMQDIYILKFDPNGNTIWGKSFGGTNNEYVGGFAIDKTGSIYLTGHFYSSIISFDSNNYLNSDGSGDRSDIYVTKLAASVGVNEIKFKNSSLIFPNPVHNKFYVKFPENETGKIFVLLSNTLGQKVYETSADKKSLLTLDASSFVNGIYFLTIKSEMKVETFRIVKQ